MADGLYIDSLTESQIATLEARLRPGKNSVAGFLGSNESLKDIIYEDAETLCQLSSFIFTLAFTSLSIQRC